MRSALALPLLLSLLAAPAPARAGDAADAARRLHEVAALRSAWIREDSLLLRRMHGLPIERLPEVSRARAEADAARAWALLARLDEIDRSALGDDDRLTWEILRFDLQGVFEAPRFWSLHFPVLPYTSPLPAVARIFAEWSFADADAVAAFAALQEQMPRLVAELRAQLEAQAGAGIRIPRPALDPVVGMLRAFAAPPPASPFAPAAERLTGLPAAERAATAERLAAFAAERIATPLAALADWVDGSYREAAPEGVGLAQYPLGAELYRWLIRRHLSYDLAPEELHAIGLAELAALRDEMDAIRREVGFAGTLADFKASVLADRRFYAATPEEVGERLMAPLRRIEPVVERFFAVTPAAPYGVRRLEPQLEGGQTFGYYNPPSPEDPVGIYYFNGSRLDERPLLWAAGLIAHELVPGHHFQIARAVENEALPDYRRDFFDTAYIEGWAEYASDLAGEMGIYADAWDRLGRIAMASFLASRLVVDTGMNALGWSRERALELLREHTFQSETEIRSETLRYAVDMPGQALAYRFGARQIAALRARAERELAEAFDLRRFHEAILGQGAMPLAVLERHVERWIEREAAR
jgi:uncharacterized protein (DUF885 family)